MRPNKSSPMNSRNGFTLIELLVVISIIGLLSSVSMAALSTARKKARDARRIHDLVQLRNAYEMYFIDKGAYPNAYGAPGSANCGSIAYPDANRIPTSYINPIPQDPLFNPAVDTSGNELPHAYLYCNESIDTATSSWNPNMKTYALMAALEHGSGNIAGTSWATTTRFINAKYNYVIANFTP